MPILFVASLLLARGIVRHGFQSTNQSEIRNLLQKPVCLLPIGQAIDVGELPRSAYRLDWMKRLRPELPVSLVTIPGTHDAGSALGRTGDTRCQTLTIPSQIAVGVRGFDVRLRLVKSDLKVYHHEESQKVEFETVLKAFHQLLTRHRSEFIVLRIREESAAVEPTETFEEGFAKAIAPYGKDFYVTQSRTDIPTVGQLRGKILLLDNYGKLPGAIDYPNSTMDVQDDYDTSDMAKKFSEITANLDSAQDQTEAKPWRINYTSSATPLVNQLDNARAVNAKVTEYLVGKRGHLGLVFINFPGVQEIDHLINSNF